MTFLHKGTAHFEQSITFVFQIFHTLNYASQKHITQHLRLPGTFSDRVLCVVIQTSMHVCTQQKVLCAVICSPYNYTGSHRKNELGHIFQPVRATMPISETGPKRFAVH